ncbi:MBL fold metallo-hydrolase [Marinivivus vitaminiproducens]|uniref:MBL fold metallo-hydrolase n=1 Tax=Marinivivus vitaminiproducens TaxID=3035935 RepID=UPI0027A84EC4|nr:MBL fold metallo-hydrolase [Geminicoccaceae bacterium SCSIO 64248]
MNTEDPSPDPRARRRLDRRGVIAALLASPGLLLPHRSAALPAGGPRPWHHTDDGFRNPPGSPVRQAERSDWNTFFRQMRAVRKEEVALPEDFRLSEEEALAGIRALGDRDGITWLGHAAFLIRLGGVTFLTDPYLSPYASPVPPFGPKRFTPPGITVERLPPVDVLMLSHNHYDHMDLWTIEKLRDRERMTAVVPLGLAGYPKNRRIHDVRAMDWHTRTDVRGVRVTAVPAIHASQRWLWDRNRTLWTGYVLEANGRRIYFAGDTGYGPVFADTGRRYGPFDVGLVPIGAYEPRLLMEAVHTTPEEAIRLGSDMRCRSLIGMHWGAIRLTPEPVLAPKARLQAAAEAAGYAPGDVTCLRLGETRAL